MDNLIIREVTPKELEQMAKEYDFKEDKEQTVLAMLVMLRTTRAFNRTLEDMTYVRHDNGDESVECLFKYRNGRTETVSVNVTADSCIALISDVFKRLYEMI